MSLTAIEWAREQVVSGGFGQIATTSISGSPTFASCVAINTPIPYAFVTSFNTPIESGIGQLTAGGLFERIEVHRQFIDGVYTEGADLTPTSIPPGAILVSPVTVGLVNSIKNSIPAGLNESHVAETAELKKLETDLKNRITGLLAALESGLPVVGGVVRYAYDAPEVSPLVPLSYVHVFEAPHGVLTPTQRTNTAVSGGYTMFAVGRSNINTSTFAVYVSGDPNGSYNKILDNQPYAAHADLVGTINVAHPTLAFTNATDIGPNVSAGTLALMADTAGQQELLTVGGYNTYTELGDTVTVFEGVQEAVYDSIPIQVDSEDTARIYLLNSVVMDPTYRANGTTVYYKVVPKTASGAELPLGEVAPVAITISGIASAPYKPHNVGFAHTLGNASELLPSDFVQYPTVPYSQRYNLHVRMGNSSRTDTTVRGWFNEAPVAESGVAYRMDIYGAADTVIRTKTADANGLLTYTFNEQGSDGFLALTKYSVYAEKDGRRSRENIIYIGAGVRDSGDVTAISGVQSGSNVVFTVTVQSRSAPYGVDFALAGNAFADGNTGTPTLSTGASFLEQNAIQVDPNTTSFTVTVPFTGAAGKTLTLQLGRLSNSSGIVSNSVVIAGNVTVASVSSPTVFEGTTLVYTVTLSGTTSSSQNFSFTTVGGTATSGADFNASATFNNGVTQSGDTITVPSGVASFTVSVLTIDDATTEVAETVTVNVGGVTGTGTINDNDSGFVAIFNALAVSMSNATNEAVGPAGNTEITFTYPAQFTDIYFDIHPPTAATTMPVLLPEIPVNAIIRVEFLIRTDTSGLAAVPFLFTSAQNGFSKVGLTALTGSSEITSAINVSPTAYGTTRAIIRAQNTRGTPIPVSERLSFYIRQNGPTVPLNAAIKDVTIAIE